MVCCFLWKANTLQKRVKNPWVKLHNNQEPEYTRIESLSWEIQWACFTRGIAIANSFFFSTDPLMLMWSLFPKKWAVSSFDILLPTNIRKTMHPFQLQEHVAKSGPEPSRGWKNYLFSSSFSSILIMWTVPEKQSQNTILLSPPRTCHLLWHWAYLGSKSFSSVVGFTQQLSVPRKANLRSGN